MLAKFKFIIIILLSLLKISQAIAETKINDIFGIGHANIDVIYYIPYDDLKRHILIPYGIKSGDILQVDSSVIESFYDLFKGTIFPGGEVANVIADYASLGGRVSFNSNISSDDHGLLFHNDMINQGVVDINQPQRIKENTVVNIVLITPDNMRTIISNSKFYPHLSQQYIRYHNIKDYKLVLAEGSLWNELNDESSKAIYRAFKVAKRVGSLRAFMLSNIYYVNKYKTEFLKLLIKIDFLIGTEEELKALFDHNDLTKMIDFLKQQNYSTIISRGALGAIVIHKSEIIKSPLISFDRNEILDITGADDGFTAGFFYGFLNNKSLEESCKLGNNIASQLIKQIGARPNKKLFNIL